MSRAIAASVFCSSVSGTPLKMPLSPQRNPSLWLFARHDGQVNLDETCDAPDGVVDGSDCLRHEQRSRGLNNDVTHAMPDEDLHRDLRVRLDLIGQIHNRAGNAVSDFVRVGRVYFLNHE